MEGYYHEEYGNYLDDGRVDGMYKMLFNLYISFLLHNLKKK